MNNKIKFTLSMAALVFAAGQVSTVSAHTLAFKFLQTAGGAAATDVWETTCSADPVLGDSARLAIHIKDRSPGTPKLTAIAYKDGQAATTTDALPGDPNYSDFVFVNAGNGVYTMIVNHTGAAGGFDFYDLEFHCENAAGAHTPTTSPVSPVQDQ